MIIGDRLRLLREQKNLSQGDIEKRTGLHRSYISRVEWCHLVPAVESLEKFARALEVPMCQLFYEGEQPPKPPKLPKGKTSDIEWGNSGTEARLLAKFRRLLSHMEESDMNLLMSMAQNMARKRTVSNRKTK
jgi:transcriptional regulator with XRE-family HTH domain